MTEILLVGEPLDGRGGHEAGRQLLRRLYRQHTGRECPEILVTDRGKPCFAEGNLHFSISHTKRHVFCALYDAPIGIDAEEMDRNINLKLADKILSPAEKFRFDGTRQALLRLWVLKEAAVKCSGEGLRGYPNHTDFSPDDPRIRELCGCFVAVITDEKEKFHAL